MASIQQAHHQPLQVAVNQHRPCFPNRISSLRFKPLSIRASISNDSSGSSSSNPNRKSASPLLQTTCAAIAAAAFFLGRFNRGMAAPVAPAAAEERVRANVEELRGLMEEKIKANKLAEAVEVLERLSVEEPEELEWALLKANVHSFMGENEVAAGEFEEILKREPQLVEALHGLAMAAASRPEKLGEVAKRVEAAMKRVEKAEEVRDLKLLVAQIMVMESKYGEALKVYQQLVKEEPRDFRPYLCLGIIYTLLKKEQEAQLHFDTFRRLLPSNHPYREYFEDNMFATKLFSKAHSHPLPATPSS